MKRYLVDLLMNARDLGGYPAKNGKTTVMGRYIRSDAPHYLSEEGRQFFYDLGVRTVIDLRTEEIATRYPSVFQSDARFRYQNDSISEGSEAYDRTKPEKDQAVTYLKMLEHEDTFFHIFFTMAQAPGTIFYNCSAGKDRTGIVTFMLLDLVGVPDKVIIDDYAVSEKHIAERIGLVQAVHPDFPRSMGKSNPETMRQFIALFRARYRTAHRYLRHIGLSEYRIRQLKTKLVGDANGHTND